MSILNMQNAASLVLGYIWIFFCYGLRKTQHYGPLPAYSIETVIKRSFIWPYMSATVAAIVIGFWFTAHSLVGFIIAVLLCYPVTKWWVRLRCRNIFLEDVGQFIQDDGAGYRWSELSQCIAHASGLLMLKAEVVPLAWWADSGIIVTCMSFGLGFGWIYSDVFRTVL